MTNEEALLRVLNGEELAADATFQPQNNAQAYLAYAVGLLTDADALPEPRTNEEVLLYNLVLSGMGGSSADSLEDEIITRQLTEYTNSRVTKVGAGALAYFHKLEAASFPRATAIDKYAFSGCTNLKSVSVPLAENLYERAFMSCTSLEEISLPKVYTIIGYAFYGCTNLKKVDLPKIACVPEYCFRGCSSLTEVKFPTADSLYQYAFYDCAALTTVDLPSCAAINGNGVFTRCPALATLILRSETFCSVALSSALAGTLIAGGTGYIYVPAALVEEYKANSNWSTYADQFRALEDYTVDGTTTGDLDPTKI